MKSNIFILVASLISVSAFAKDGKGTMAIFSGNDPLTVRVERNYHGTADQADQSAELNIPKLFWGDDRRIDNELAASQGKMFWETESRRQNRERAALDVRKVLQEVANCYSYRGPSTETSVECYGPAALAMMKQFQYLDASDTSQKDDGTMPYSWAKAFSGNKGKMARTRDAKELIFISFDHTVLESIKIGSVSCAKVGATESSKDYEMAEQYPYFCTIGLLK